MKANKQGTAMTSEGPANNMDQTTNQIRQRDNPMESSQSSFRVRKMDSSKKPTVA